MRTYKLTLFTAAMALVAASCDNLDPIDKEYNPLEYDDDMSYFTGELRQGDEVVDARLVMFYENGLGRSAGAYILNDDGLYSDSLTVKLAEGSGQVEIPVKGIPEKGGAGNALKIKAFIQLETHNVYKEFEAEAIQDILLYGSESTLDGSLVTQAQVTDAAIELIYNSTQAYEVQISASEVLGLEVPEVSMTLPAAPNNGSVRLPLSGKPTSYGDYTLTVRLVKGDQEYTTSVTVYVRGEIGFDSGESYLKGDLVRGQAITGQTLMVAYEIYGTSDLEMTVVMDESDGIYVDEYLTVLTASGTGFVEVPLAGTPQVSGDKALTVNFEKDDIVYTATVNVFIETTGGEQFVEETFIWNGLEYKTIHIDINNDSYVDAGEVWLDRNIGATSNDPGLYGANNGNPDSYGHYYQYGVSYGSSFITGYSIDFDAMTPWNICPDGYRVPTRTEFARAVQAAIPGSTLDDNNPLVTVPGGNVAEALLDSPFRLPAVGALVEDVPQNVGLYSFYWTTDKGSDTAPWRIEFTSSATSGQNWAGPEWQHPVRCVRE
ncbi:MAG: fibrobacter succinogenes major paralogous domain-containing protein [Alistipes sp.]|nr:fibrobacter succinogenes major paralogous domain-containing protein [Alistipes sp.]